MSRTLENYLRPKPKEPEKKFWEYYPVVEIRLLDASKLHEQERLVLAKYVDVSLLDGSVKKFYDLRYPQYSHNLDFYDKEEGKFYTELQVLLMGDSDGDGVNDYEEGDERHYGLPEGSERRVYKDVIDGVEYQIKIVAPPEGQERIRGALEVLKKDFYEDYEKTMKQVRNVKIVEDIKDPRGWGTNDFPTRTAFFKKRYIPPTKNLACAIDHERAWIESTLLGERIEPSKLRVQKTDAECDKRLFGL